MSRIGAALVSALIALAWPVWAASQERSVRESNPPQLEKIVGGQKAKPQDWPYIVAILRIGSGAREIHCGGSLIASQWVLTAAHCFQPGADSASQFEIVVGAPKLTAPNLRRSNVAQVILHPGFNPVSFENDIALLKLAEPVNGPVLPLSLSETTDPTGGLLLAAGYGRTQQDQIASWRVDGDGKYIAVFSDDLLQVSLPLQSTQDCARGYANLKVAGAKDLVIGAANLCAGYALHANQEKDTCRGDSGGPLVAYDGRGRALGVGIVSFGAGCAVPGVYGVYTRISAHAAWLKSNIPGFAGSVWAAAKSSDVGVQPPPKLEGLADLLAGLAPARDRVRMAACSAEQGDGEPCQAGPFSIGDMIALRVTSTVSGPLILIDIDPIGTVTQVFPEAGAPLSASWVEAGKTRVFREAATGLNFGAVPPCGKGRFIALVAPPTVDFSAFLQNRGAATKSIGRLPSATGAISDRVYAAELANEVLALARSSGPDLKGWGWIEIATDVRPSKSDPTCSIVP